MDSISSASPALLAAAMGGLLGLTACGSDSVDPAAATPDAAIQGLQCATEDPEPKTTSSTPNTPDPGEAAFRSECAQAGGKFEIIAHCGGLASGRGFAYDRTTSTRSEHTCRGANSCTGYNCVVCND